MRRTPLLLAIVVAFAGFFALMPANAHDPIAMVEECRRIMPPPPPPPVCMVQVIASECLEELPAACLVEVEMPSIESALDAIERAEDLDTQSAQ